MLKILKQQQHNRLDNSKVSKNSYYRLKINYISVIAFTLPALLIFQVYDTFTTFLLFSFKNRLMKTNPACSHPEQHAVGHGRLFPHCCLMPPHNLDQRMISDI